MLFSSQEPCIGNLLTYFVTRKLAELFSQKIVVSITVHYQSSTLKPVLRIRIEKMRMRMRMRIRMRMRMRMRIRIRMRMRIHALTELWRPKYWYKKFLKGQSSEILVPFLTYMERPRPDFQKF